MKLSEYIKALQELQDQHSGLDIEVMVPHPSTRTNGGVYVVPATERMQRRTAPSGRCLPRRFE